MERKINGVVLYREQWDPVQDLSLEQKGILFEAIFHFLRQEPYEIKDPTLAMAFSFMRNKFISDQTKYEAKCERNREFAHKRWDKRLAEQYESLGGRGHTDASERMRTHANASERMRTDTNDANYNRNGNLNRNSNNNENRNQNINPSGGRPAALEDKDPYTEPPADLMARVKAAMGYEEKYAKARAIGGGAVTMLNAKLEKALYEEGYIWHA